MTRDHQSAVKAGQETVDTIACTIYDLKTNDGAIHKYWVGDEDGLVRKVAMTVESPMGQIPIQVKTSEYKAIDKNPVPAHDAYEAGCAEHGRDGRFHRARR